MDRGTVSRAMVNKDIQYSRGTVSQVRHRTPACARLQHANAASFLVYVMPADVLLSDTVL